MESRTSRILPQLWEGSRILPSVFLFFAADFLEVVFLTPLGLPDAFSQLSDSERDDIRSFSSFHSVSERDWEAGRLDMTKTGSKWL